MLKISNIDISLDEKNYQKVIANALNMRMSQIKNVKLVKKAVDARRKNKVHFHCAFTFETDHEQQVIQNHPKSQLTVVQPYHYDKVTPNKKTIMIVGSGPAGLFCAYNLARSGQKVILVEQGKDVNSRKKDIDLFLKTGKLNTSSNVQFGEGGAGTFSDGKLTTGVKDFRKQFVLETFVKYGAHDDILYLNKPHLGTDVLIDVIQNIRKAIIDYGGEVYFETKFIDFTVRDQRLDQVVLLQHNQKKTIKVDQLVLAIGHSSRETYEMLYHKGLTLQQKAFAVGFRIEHSQDFINKHQYGKFYNHPALKAADYKLAVHTNNDRGVYTFCMCPGGYVINASSEEKRICVNGMSNCNRDHIYANSAILVTVDKHDFKNDHPLAGMYFQRELESKAYQLGGSDYSVPVQRVEDYLEDKITEEKIQASLKRIKSANLNDIFSNEVNINLKEGLQLMNQKIAGFTNNAILLGVEARSSAPVRFYRDEKMESNIKGIYPIGEGAGYAGGIMSSAIDGLKCSEILVKGE